MAGANLTEELAAILAYLSANPQAADTLEGIAVWWIPRSMQPVRYDRLEAALEQLVVQGILQRRVASAGRVVYSRLPRESS